MIDKIVMDKSTENFVIRKVNDIELAFQLIIKYIQDEMNKRDKVYRPKYIIEMIDEGLLYPDGQRVVSTLEEVAIYLKDKEEFNITQQFLLELFRKSNGKPYSQGSAKAALDAANTQRGKVTWSEAGLPDDLDR
jgi:hypothetical protein